MASARAPVLFGVLLTLVAPAIAATVGFSFMVEDYVTDFYAPNQILTSPAAINAPGTVIKLAQLINQQYPGPTIIVDEGDIVEVNVTNMLDTRSLTLHWHSLEQFGTPWSDGVAMITQCPIPPMTTYTYKFVAEPAGTRWYHAHNGNQIEYGVAGSMIIRPKTDPFAGQYTDDLILAVTDWWQDPLKSQLSFEPNYNQLPLALINGQWGNGTTAYPYPVLNITTGTCARLRIVSMALHIHEFDISIAGHNLTIISLDGNDVQSFVVGSVSIFSAERIDALLCANQPPGQYLITVQTALAFGTGPFSYYAFLQYSTANQTPPTSPVGTDGGSFAAAVSTSVFNSMTSLSLIQSLVDVSAAAAQPDITFTLEMGFRLDTYLPWFVSPTSTPFEHPSTPLLQTINQCSAQSQETEILAVPPRSNNQPSVVRLILNNLSEDPHPMHLHGHRMVILGNGYDPAYTTFSQTLPFANATCPSGQPAVLAHPSLTKWQDSFWGCPYNSSLIQAAQLKPSAYKDTVVVPPHTWAIVQFYADNPGVWFFHCHIQHHHLEGMATVFSVLPALIPPTPASALLTCGQQCTTSSAVVATATIVPTVLSTATATATPVVTVDGDTQADVSDTLITLAVLLVAAVGMAIIILAMERRFQGDQATPS